MRTFSHQVGLLILVLKTHTLQWGNNFCSTNQSRSFWIIPFLLKKRFRINDKTWFRQSLLHSLTGLQLPTQWYKAAKGPTWEWWQRTELRKKKKKHFQHKGGCKGKFSIPSALCVLLLKHTRYLMAIGFPATDITSIKIWGVMTHLESLAMENSAAHLLAFLPSSEL